MALYPPIVASSMPAFDILDEFVKIYFSLSNYNANKASEIQLVHVSVRTQQGNSNMVGNGSEILLKLFYYDTIMDQYYIIINSNDLKLDSNGETFIVDRLYKVQLRFSSIKCEDTNLLANFLSTNLKYFSEWSTVCLIKPINSPTFGILELLDNYGRSTNVERTTIFTYPYADFSGFYLTTTGSSIETLKSWRLRLLTDDYTEDDKLNIDNYILADSGTQAVTTYTYNLNEETLILTCSLPYEFTNKESYKIFFEITTRNDYYGSKLYSFTYEYSLFKKLEGTLTTSVNEEDGYIKVTYNAKLGQTVLDNVVIRRSDSKGKFLNWQDMKNFVATGISTFDYYDFTAESGMAYRYMAQLRGSRGTRGTPLLDSTASVANSKVGAATIGEWDHALLLETSGNGDATAARQLKMKYDFQISSMKTNVALSKTDTLGSKYPFIKRNGVTYYRSFPITGTITAYMDNTKLFVTKNVIDDVITYTDDNGSLQSLNVYDKYRNINSVQLTYRYDYTYERKFREFVELFLYNEKPKLYKSMQEGNIFIKLMEVSLTPKNELGRLIYTFSATAYLIDDSDLITLNNYGLINIGNYNPNIGYINQSPVLGQIATYTDDNGNQQNLFTLGTDIISLIKDKYNYNVGFNGLLCNDFKITYLRLTIESLPYLIGMDLSGNYIILDDINEDESTNTSFGSLTYPLYHFYSEYNNITNIFLGTLIEINGKPIIISYPNNIYLLKDLDVLITPDMSIVVKKDTEMLCDFNILLSYEQDTSKIIKKILVLPRVGQIYGNYPSGRDLIRDIKTKYMYEYSASLFATDCDRIVQHLDSGLISLNIDTDPYAVFYIKTNQFGINEDPYRAVINLTGLLIIDLENIEYYITSLVVYGKGFYLLDLKERLLNNGEYTTIENPENKDYVLTENEEYYVYYNSQWNAATLHGDMLDIACNLDVMLFYDIKIRSDFY